jgi:hypothetical protein
VIPHKVSRISAEGKSRGPLQHCPDPFKFLAAFALEPTPETAAAATIKRWKFVQKIENII